MALAKEPHARVFGLDAKLYPNTAGALGLQDIRVLDALYVQRYLRYVRTFIAPNAYDRFTGTELPVAFRSNPMFDALPVRAIQSQHDLADAPGFRLLGRDRDTRVYENRNSLPRAWLAHDVHVVGGEDDAFRYLKSQARREGRAFIVEGFDPRRQAVVESHGETLDAALGALKDGHAPCGPAPQDDVRIEQYSAGNVTLAVDAACDGVLVLPDVYFPGWTATVNGHDRTVYATDGAFRGVVVPKGASRVDFRYAPRAFPIGIALAAGALAIFLVVGIVSIRRGQRWAH
jgi:hypothetical protein